MIYIDESIDRKSQCGVNAESTDVRPGLILGSFFKAHQDASNAITFIYIDKHLALDSILLYIEKLYHQEVKSTVLTTCLNVVFHLYFMLYMKATPNSPLVNFTVA